MLGALGEVVLEGRDGERCLRAVGLDHHGGHAGVVRAIGRGAGVGQFDGDVGLGLVGQVQDVRGIATFGDRGSAADAQGGSLDGIRDRSDRRRIADVQFLEVATAGFGDLRRNVACIDIDVIGRRRNGNATGELARFDADDGAVAELDGHVGAGLVGQGGGVGDLATFFDGGRGA
ncbi:hypothetical protein D3C72_1376080 [compost metagenome]